ncbi:MULTISPECIES: hypothetical protein [Planktothricoides]
MLSIAISPYGEILASG